ncbi:MAG TPA: phosphohistidine phosphatase SixA [Gemmataceae bacterium]|nr:phosphohistidine phosphatase SixA [Gemmataceae bacterium]
MELYLIRHAEAAAVGDASITRDADRPLTDVGRQQCDAMAQTLQKLKVHLDAIVSSPLLRAKQTCDTLIQGLSAPKPASHILEEIGFEVRPKVIVEFVKDLKVESAAIVGHQPGLSRFAAWLIGSKKAQLDMAKAGLARIQCEELAKGGGTLLWLLTPDWYK